MFWSGRGDSQFYGTGEKKTVKSMLATGELFDQRYTILHGYFITINVNYKIFRFLSFFLTLLHLPPSDWIVSEDAGI
jgi:hypothetical protein